jgi:hypothetical protein
MNHPVHHETGSNNRKDLAVLDGGWKRLQTRTRQTFWDKMHLAKVIERPFLDWDKVEW